jgi:16S rRNA (guanine527-N7)-methyltransferase
MVSAFGPKDFQKATGVSRETLARLEAMLASLDKWQKTINLISAKSREGLWRRHMLDSAQLMAHLPPGPEDRVIADLGSGGGFPGLVLAILGAGHVHLIESDQRKCAFLREAARETAAPVTVHARRTENLKSDELQPGPVDVIVARALAPLDRLLDLASPLMTGDNVCLFLKGQDVALELTRATKSWNMEVESIPSRSDPEHAGTILRLRNISRV